jgi:hypothetical protein
MEDRVKTCTKCGEEKEFDAFPNEAKRGDGKYPWCRPCLSEHRKNRYVAVPRKVWTEQKVCSKCKQWKPREEYRKYAGNNLHYRCISCEDFESKLEAEGKTECSACKQVKDNSEFFAGRLKKTSKQCKECIKDHRTQDTAKLKARDSSLQKFFGITLEDYKSLLEVQDHKCPICLKEFEKDNFSYPVDHAHAGPNAGAIRAILHDRCNRFVMWKHTDPEQLRRAADLLESPLTEWYVPEEYLKGRKAARKKKKT